MEEKKPQDEPATPASTRDTQDGGAGTGGTKSGGYPVSGGGASKGAAGQQGGKAPDSTEGGRKD